MKSVAEFVLQHVAQFVVFFLVAFSWQTAANDNGGHTITNATDENITVVLDTAASVQSARLHRDECVLLVDDNVFGYLRITHDARGEELVMICGFDDCSQPQNYAARVVSLVASDRLALYPTARNNSSECRVWE